MGNVVFYLQLNYCNLLQLLKYCNQFKIYKTQNLSSLRVHCGGTRLADQIRKYFLFRLFNPLHNCITKLERSIQVSKSLRDGNDVFLRKSCEMVSKVFVELKMNFLRWAII